MRGAGRQPLTTRCQTIQDIIDMGQQAFPAFAARNPWICIDSKHATVFVDPERQSGKEAAPLNVTVTAALTGTVRSYIASWRGIISDLLSFHGVPFRP